MRITEIAGYRAIRELGAGGMGQVFLVQHPRLPRHGALKLLDAGVSRNDDFKARFQRPSPTTTRALRRNPPPSVVTTTAESSTTAPTLSATSTAPPTGKIGGSGANVSHTVEPDTPTVQIAYAPSQWQNYTLEYSNLAGRYALSIQTYPDKSENVFIAVRGSTSQHCRIRVSGQVVSVDNGVTQAVCQA